MTTEAGTTFGLGNLFGTTSDAETTGGAATTTMAPSFVWVDLGSRIQCDTSNGEVFLQTSPGRGPSLEQCRQLCQDDAACQSITYFKNGYCSHYSTPCTNTKQN